MSVKELSTYIISEHISPLEQQRSQILQHFHPILHDLAQVSIFSPKRRYKNNGTDYLALPESMRASLSRYFKTDKERKDFFAQAKQDGYFFSFDGNKVRAIDEQFGKSAADSYVTTNMEIVIQSLQSLGYLEATFKCSGDEGFGLAIAQNGNVFDESKIRDVITSNTKKYFTDNQEYKLMDDYLRSQFKELADKKYHMGLEIHFKKASDCVMRAPRTIQGTEKVQEFRARQLGSAIIDACDNKEIPAGYQTTPILEELQKAEARVIALSEEASQKFDASKLPSSIKKVYELTIIKIRQAETENPDMLIRQAQALAENASYETLFPRSMEVRRREHLEEDIETLVSQGLDVHLGRLSDIEVKEANKFSHMLGDYELIATVSIVSRLIKAGNINNFQIFQEGGNFYYLTWDDPKTDEKDTNRLRVISAIGDSFNLNKTNLLNEQTRKQVKLKDGQVQDPTDRAFPFIVTCPRIYNSTNQTAKIVLINRDNISNINQIIFELTETHRILEHLVPFVVTTILAPAAITMVDSIAEFLTKLELTSLPSKNNSPTLPNQGPSVRVYHRYLTSFTRYLYAREGRKEYFLNLAQAYFGIKDPRTWLEKILASINYFRFDQK